MPLDNTDEGHCEELIQDLLRSGHYASRSEVIRSALRLLQEHEAERQKRRAELLGSIDDAIADIDDNGGIPAEQVFVELDDIIRSRAAGRDAAE